MMLPLAALLTSSFTYTCAAKKGCNVMKRAQLGLLTAAPLSVLCRYSLRTFGLLAAFAMSASVSQSRRPASSDSGDSLPAAPRGVEGSLLVGTLATCRCGAGAVAGEVWENDRGLSPRSLGSASFLSALSWPSGQTRR